jgi:hypothetical protein
LVEQHQASELYRAITEAGLDPANFDWQVVELTFLYRSSERYTADMLVREAKPNLWESIAESTTLAAGALNMPPTRFTSKEQAEILARLDAMARQVEALDALSCDRGHVDRLAVQRPAAQRRRLAVEVGGRGDSRHGDWDPVASSDAPPIARSLRSHVHSWDVPADGGERLHHKHNEITIPHL